MTGEFDKIAEKIAVVVQGGNVSIENINILQPQSLLQSGTPQNLPYSGAKEFVGRLEELSTLHNQLHRNDRLIISAVSGMGGVRKTELALQYALQHIDTYSGGICWLRARGASLGTQIVEFCRLHLSLEVPLELGGELLDVCQQVQWCLQHWSLPEKQVLLILDDVTHVASVRELAQGLPKRFRVLVTTRQRQLEASFLEISLNVFSIEDSLELLANLISEKHITQESQIARVLCEWLGYLPLGLELVGRYLIEDPDLSLTEMLNRLKNYRLSSEALDFDEQEIQQNYMMTAQRGVRAAFELTWQELVELERTPSGLSNRLFSVPKFFSETTGDTSKISLYLFVSLFAPDPFPWGLVELAAESLKWQANEVENIKSRLYKRHLIQRISENYYKVHPLIREFLQVKLEKSKFNALLRQTFVRMMSRIGQQIFECETYQQYQLFSPVISHLIEATTSLVNYLKNDDLVWTFTALGLFYQHGQIDYDLAESFYKAFLSTAQTRLGEHRHVADTFNNLGLLYERRGRYPEAESYHIKAIEMYKGNLGENHPRVASSLTNLADIYFAIEDYEKAESLYIQGFKIRHEKLSKDHPDIMNSVRGLFQLYLYQGRFEDAETVLKKALENRDANSIEKCPDDIASILSNFSALYIAQEAYEKAEQFSLRALETWHQSGACQSTATALSNLAVIYEYQKRYSESEICNLQAIELLKELKGNDYPSVARQLSHLAEFYSKIGRYDDAESTCLAALESTRKILGHRSLEVANILNKLGKIYVEQEEFVKAESVFKQAVETGESVLGEDNNIIAGYLSNYALSFHKQKKYTQAKALYQKALATEQTKFGMEHEEVALTIHNLSALYDDEGRWDEAIPLCLQAQSIWEKTIGIDDPLFARSLDRLAGIYVRQGKLDEAERLYRQVLAIREDKLGIEHRDTVNTIKAIENLRKPSK